MNVIHGDVAARNIVVPVDPSRSPVWIDFRSLARDVEEGLTWAFEKTKERDALVTSIVLESGSPSFPPCPCQGEQDSWCADYISWYGSVFGKPTDVAPQPTIQDAGDLGRAEDAEWDLREIWAAKHGDCGFLERNVPLRQLLNTSVDLRATHDAMDES